MVGGEDEVEQTS